MIGRKLSGSPVARSRHGALAGSKHDPFLECDAVRDYWFDCLDRFIAERLAEIPSDTKH